MLPTIENIHEHRTCEKYIIALDHPHSSVVSPSLGHQSNDLRRVASGKDGSAATWLLLAGGDGYHLWKLYPRIAVTEFPLTQVVCWRSERAAEDAATDERLSTYLPIFPLVGAYTKFCPDCTADLFS
ncbi:hypothetical protein CLAIMM_06718 isoform 2 [Cladophialophora immunda]|nr:hypothetical protein CLAIMM_06718 isoform 2 [Cladophialophora immunda]